MRVRTRSDPLSKRNSHKAKHVHVDWTRHKNGGYTCDGCGKVAYYGDERLVGEIQVENGTNWFRMVLQKPRAVECPHIRYKRIEGKSVCVECGRTKSGIAYKPDMGKVERQVELDELPQARSEVRQVRIMQ